MKTLGIIEKDESNGWEPIVLARKLLKYGMQKSVTAIYYFIIRTKLAVALKSFLPGKLFAMIL